MRCAHVSLFKSITYSSWPDKDRPRHRVWRPRSPASPTAGSGVSRTSPKWSGLYRDDCDARHAAHGADRALRAYDRAGNSHRATLIDGLIN